MSEPREGLDAGRTGPRDAELLLLVSPNAMSVEARVVPPEPGGRNITREQVLQELARLKVVFGIDHAAIDRLVEMAEKGFRLDRQGIVVAEGRPPVDGQDAAIIHHPLLQTPAGYPRLTEDGRADFFDLNLVRNVAKDTVLATRKPPTPGEPGIDVFGRTVKAREGRDVRLRAGAGTRLSPDGQSVIATVEGHASISASGEVTVSPIFTVPGDVGYGSGNIDFVGTVVVRGDVTQGFTVKAGGNVEVHGGIMGGSVEAGGDVLVRYGIVGAGRGRVKAGGKVRCRFIESAEVEAAGDVVVSDGILNSQVSGDSVLVTGGRGSIIGGRIRARREISAQTLGSPMGAATDLQVGVPPAVRGELDQIREQLARVEDRFGQATRTATYLNSGAAETARISREFAEKSRRLTGAERQQLAGRLAALQSQLEPEPGACVKGYEAVYPGVRITIGAQRHVVVDQSTNSCFVIGEDGEIRLVPAW
ncbi:DUF342 domain-containing protein [Symbiobacterium thermophilum]|uniref:DUF342 domain-containing protein n=1 Tax=Symbiobacterium thermophilum TaxID=2734 RepID=UPI0035C68158